MILTCISLRTNRGFPSNSDGKESACNAGDPGSVPRLRRSPGERNATHSISLPGEFHEQRSLAGYSPRGRKKLDTTERLTHTHTHTHTRANNVKYLFACRVDQEGE